MPMLNFEVTTEPIDGGVVFNIRGDLDVQSVRIARAELDEIEREAPDLLVLNLAELSFCDSTGMGLITATHLKAAKANRRCVIVRPRQPVYQAFALTGLEPYMEMAESVDEAVRSARG
jgi:anti-anti-sigma factor